MSSETIMVDITLLILFIIFMKVILLITNIMNNPPSTKIVSPEGTIKLKYEYNLLKQDTLDMRNSFKFWASNLATTP